MNPTSPIFGTENQSPYQVDSRKEIIGLLRNLQESRQTINLIISEGTEVIITIILNVDDDNNTLIFDCPSTESATQRLIKAPRIFFEGAVNKIGIQFSLSRIIHSEFTGKPALSCAIPISLIRLQRREYYRINTPLTQPILCVIPLPEENGGGTVKLPMADISCGGVAILDEKRMLNVDFGTLYEHCKIDLPGIGLVMITLEVRNSQNLSLLNGKTSRRIGFQFMNLSKTMMAQIQKLITKIERERNARGKLG